MHSVFCISAILQFFCNRIPSEYIAIALAIATGTLGGKVDFAVGFCRLCGVFR